MDTEKAQKYVLEKLQPILCRYAHDGYLFPDQKTTREAFVALRMDNVVKAIDDAVEENEKNRRMTESWSKPR
jgi:hypothetical protein